MLFITLRVPYFHLGDKLHMFRTWVRVPKFTSLRLRISFQAAEGATAPTGAGVSEEEARHESAKPTRPPSLLETFRTDSTPGSSCTSVRTYVLEKQNATYWTLDANFCKCSTPQVYTCRSTGGDRERDEVASLIAIRQSTAPQTANDRMIVILSCQHLPPPIAERLVHPKVL